MKRTTAPLAALTSATALLLLSASPALAAGEPVATADATALTLTLAGQGADSGTVLATHDGTAAKVTGRTNPPVSVLNNQALANLGVLAQSATASLDSSKRGLSKACAGVAGDGGQIVEVGDTSCLKPGNAVALSVGNLNLTGAVLVNPDSALAPLGALQPVIDQLVGPLTKAITDGLAPLRSGLVEVNLSAISSWCVADPGRTPVGNSTLADASINLAAAGRSFPLVKLPVNPAANTDLLVNLDGVVAAVLDGVEVQINETLDGALKPLSAVLDPVRDTLVKRLLAQIAPQLAPLSDNVLKVKLNQQVTGAGTIGVTALSLDVLPAAQKFVGSALVGARIGQVHCGPNGRATVTPPTTGPSTGPSTDPTTPASVTDPDKPVVKGVSETDGPQADTVPVTVAAGAAGETGISTRSALMAGGLSLLAAIGVASLLASRRVRP